jgi:hypothetical protein
MAGKEGFSRLSIAAGIVTPVVVFLLILASVGGIPAPEYFLRAIGVPLLLGFLAWGLVRIVGWVVDGFLT